MSILAHTRISPSKSCTGTPESARTAEQGRCLLRSRVSASSKTTAQRAVEASRDLWWIILSPLAGCLTAPPYARSFTPASLMLPSSYQDREYGHCALAPAHRPAVLGLTGR